MYRRIFIGTTLTNLFLSSCGLPSESMKFTSISDFESWYDVTLTLRSATTNEALKGATVVIAMRRDGEVLNVHDLYPRNADDSGTIDDNIYFDLGAICQDCVGAVCQEPFVCDPLESPPAPNSARLTVTVDDVETELEIEITDEMVSGDGQEFSDRNIPVSVAIGDVLVSQ